MIGLCSLVACIAYYALWVWILPRFGQYKIRHQMLVLERGEVTHKLVKVPLEQLGAWDREHDAQGRTIDLSASDEDGNVDGTGLGKGDLEK